MDQNKMRNVNEEELIKEALEFANKSYSPYSHFRVGAVLLSKTGKKFYATNIENRSYGLTVCAERNAIALAIIEGNREWELIAIASPDSEEFLSPCGACRGVLSEFSEDLVVLMGKKNGEFQKTTLKKLYPFDSLHHLKS